MTPLGYQQINNPSTATGLIVPTGATLAQISITGGQVRWRDDGTAPSITHGIPMVDGQQFSYDGDLTQIQFINTTSVAATIDVSYYK